MNSIIKHCCDVTLAQIAITFIPANAVLILAATIDYLIGDPWGWPHPVRVMGWIIEHYTKFVLKQFSHPKVRRLAGVILCLGLITGSAFVGWLIMLAARSIHPVFAIVIESICLASCFALQSLRTAAFEVLQPLTTGQLEQARSKLSQYVGRDTEKLEASEILRAILETVTENATDGVMAPLFYAIVGAITPGVGFLPLALAYKAASTLDSMIGYRTEPYNDLGWFSAQLEDRLTWLPCRLTVLTLAVLSRKPQTVWQLCRRDAIKDPSPNSGWSECAYAAVLGVQVGGINYYQGVAKEKPLLGDSIYPITPEKIDQALKLTRYCFLIWLIAYLCYTLA